jgi:16S rRNA (guanine527-N7)-methyltransferase
VKLSGPLGDQAIHELAAASARLNLGLSQERLSLFKTYVETVLIWRERLSLTGSATPLEIVRLHIVDALHVVPLIRPGARAADIGSGAGFPGIPVAIARPAAHVVLVESRRRRANFLREVIRRSGLTNAEVVEDRAESLAYTLAGWFDTTMSRALGSVELLLRLSRPLLKSGGLAIAMKGRQARFEALATQPADFSGPEISEYTVAGGRLRALLVYRRT